MKAYQRLSEKRSQFGADAISIVKDFFARSPTLSTSDNIAAYAKWALKPNGPALYKIPTPETCLIGKGEPGYIVSLTRTNTV